MGVSMEVVYEGKLHCQATHGSSNQVIATDAPVDNGGNGEAFSPTDLVAAAVGGCVLTIMGLVADRNGLDLTGTTASVVKEMVTEPIRRIGSITVVVKLPAGLRLGDADKAKLENAAYICPVKQSLHPDVNVRLTFEYPE